jgi:hypothetical protein
MSIAICLTFVSNFSARFVTMFEASHGGAPAALSLHRLATEFRHGTNSHMLFDL